jgi:hypothetical protein
MSLRIKAGYSLLDRIFLESEITDNKKIIKFVTQSRTGLQIYEAHDDQLNRPEPMA